MAWTAPFDPFAALGLERNADHKDIKTRYHQLARRYHPNRNQAAQAAQAAQHGLSEHFNELHQAWQLLSNADRRRQYIELLELYELHETVLTTFADLAETDGRLEGQKSLPYQSSEEHLSSDADNDEDLPRVPGVTHRATFDKNPKSNGLGDVAEDNGNPADGVSSGPHKGRKETFFRRGRGSGQEGADGDHNSAGLRRQKYDKLRMKELEAFYQYQDAMVDKFEAEAKAAMHFEKYEQAKWRREYFERAPREAQERVRLARILNNAAKAFRLQQPMRRRNRSSLSNGNQILSTGDPFENKQLLNLPSRTKSLHRRGWSSDISGDQTSSEEEDNSSERTASSGRHHRSPSPRSHQRVHRRWESLPSLLSVSPPSLPNGNHDPISPISGPVKVFVRQPTNLREILDEHGSDADTASASSKSPSPQPTPAVDSFTLVQPPTAADVFGRHERRSRSPGGPPRSSPDFNAHSGRAITRAEPEHFMIRNVKVTVPQYIPMDNVHDLTSYEKQFMLGVNAETDMDPHELIRTLEKLDPAVARNFEVKPDIKAMFHFRLIYSHREVVKQQHQSFIALSYRRKIHVEKRHGHYTLPLEPEMFEAVWDERGSDTEGIWIDQICIDGDSEQEKLISMSAMDMVYRSARLVVVALDDILLEEEEGALLQSHMEEFSHMVHVPASKRFRRRQTPYLDAHEDLYKALRKMMRSSWFRRAWCRHEMRLARELLFLVPCNNQVSGCGKSVIRFTGKCLMHLLGLATEVPFESSIEALKPALYAFFRDRSKLSPQERHLRSHHGNFTTVVAEVFSMEAGGDPKIAEEQREADARKDKISIILNTMECGLALRSAIREPSISLPTSQCHYMLLLLALAARDPGALGSVGHPLLLLAGAPSRTEVASSWLFEPTNVDSGLNNYRTLNRLPVDADIHTGNDRGHHYVELDLKFLRPGKVMRPAEPSNSIGIARHFFSVCEKKKFGRNRNRYLIGDETANSLFGSMSEVYVETLVGLLECGPAWLSEVCQRYGVGRWRHDLQPAYELMVALKNTDGRWPEEAWKPAAATFIMDFVNFLVIRGMPQRQITRRENWRPIWVSPDGRGKVLTFVPPGNIRAVVPRALLDPDYIHLARLWILEPRGKAEGEDLARGGTGRWTLLGKSVLFSDDVSIERLRSDDRIIRSGQKVFGRMVMDAAGEGGGLGSTLHP